MPTGITNHKAAVTTFQFPYKCSNRLNSVQTISGLYLGSRLHPNEHKILFASSFRSYLREQEIICVFHLNWYPGEIDALWTSKSVKCAEMSVELCLSQNLFWETSEVTNLDF